jgi:hypothetical protein
MPGNRSDLIPSTSPLMEMGGLVLVPGVPSSRGLAGLLRHTVEPQPGLIDVAAAPGGVAG